MREQITKESAEYRGKAITAYFSNLGGKGWRPVVVIDGTYFPCQPSRFETERLASEHALLHAKAIIDRLF